MDKIERMQEMNNTYYGRFMSYASKLRKDSKKKEAKKVHENAQALNRYFYSAAHTNSDDMVLFYNNKMESIIVETCRFMQKG